MSSEFVTLREEIGKQNIGGMCWFLTAVFGKVRRERNEFKKEWRALRVEMKGNRENTEIWDSVGLEKPPPSRT